MRKFYFWGALLFAAAFPALAEPPEAEKNIRKLHFVQDDAQDYMVSKLYHVSAIVTPLSVSKVFSPLPRIRPSS